MPGRIVSDAHFKALGAIVDKAYGLSTGQKVAEVFGDIRDGLMTAPEAIKGAGMGGYSGGCSAGRWFDGFAGACFGCGCLLVFSLSRGC